MAAKARPGIPRLFGCCDGFAPGGDLAGVAARHHIAAAAGYVNWVGRTVRQVREEAALYDAVQRHLRVKAGAGARAADIACTPGCGSSFVTTSRPAGCTLSPEPPTPLGWKLRKAGALIGAPLAAPARSRRDRAARVAGCW